MPTDYMDLSRGVGNLRMAADNIGQMVAQQRFRQALANQQMAQRQAEFEQQKQVDAMRMQLMQAQMGSERAQAGQAGAHQGFYQQQTADAQYQTGQRQALEQAIMQALTQKRRADEEEEAFNIPTDPLNLDRVAAIQATLPNAQTPVNLMRNVAQGQAMQNPRMMDMIALGTRNPVMNIPAGGTPLDLTNMQPGKQTPFRPPGLAATPLSQNAALAALLDPKFTILQPPPVQDLVYRTLGLTNQPPSIPPGVIPQPQGPVIGTIEEGEDGKYEYLGGDPANPKSWRKL